MIGRDWVEEEGALWLNRWLVGKVSGILGNLVICGCRLKCGVVVDLTRGWESP